MTGKHDLNLQIVWDRLVATCEEQARALIRAGFSTAAREAADVSAGVFDMQAQVAVLTGNVVLNQGQNVGRGNKLTVDLKTGQARLEGGRVQFLLVPGQAGPAGGGATKPN